MGMRKQALSGKHFEKDADASTALTTASDVSTGTAADAVVPAKPPIGFMRLAFQSFGELWSFQSMASLLLGLVLEFFRFLASRLIASKGMALTTANFSMILKSWQGVALLGVGLLVVLTYVVIDLFTHIYFCEDILEGQQGKVLPRLVSCVRRSFAAVPRFLTLSGLPTLVYLVLMVPLVGVGFSVGLTRGLYVPRFIMEVVETTPFYLMMYVALMSVMLVVGVLHIYTLHGVLLDGLTPGEARRQSSRLVRSHPWRLLRGFLGGLVVAFIVGLLLAIPLAVASSCLAVVGSELPVGYRVGIMEAAESGQLSDTASAVLVHRMACYFVSLLGAWVFFVYGTIFNSYAVLLASHLRRWHGAPVPAGGKPKRPRYPRRLGKHHRILDLLATIGMTAFIAFLSFACGLAHEDVLIRQEPVGIIAHRLGGIEAPENSLEGLEAAIARGCHGAETDIQRTKDGHYVINHDASFKRLTGVDRTPQDMTLDEVKELRIVDARDPSRTAEVLTLEEVLEASKGRIKLYIELKGVTADRQMVDDVVAIVRARDAVDDVALISLSYDVIAYAEATYPEFETGLLYFASYGDQALIAGDLLLMEEEIAEGADVLGTHALGKGVGVWTVNTRDSLENFLMSRVDYVITDQLSLAAEVQEELDARDDYTVIRRLIWGF